MLVYGRECQPGPKLGCTGAEEGLVWFKGSDKTPSRQVKAKGDGFCVLVCCVECVAQIYEECVTAPMEAALDEVQRRCERSGWRWCTASMFAGSKKPDLRMSTYVVSKHVSRWKEWLVLSPPNDTQRSLSGNGGGGDGASLGRM